MGTICLLFTFTPNFRWLWWLYVGYMMAICYQFTFYGQFTPFLGTATLPQYRKQIPNLTQQFILSLGNNVMMPQYSSWLWKWCHPRASTPVLGPRPTVYGPRTGVEALGRHHFQSHLENCGIIAHDTALGLNHDSTEIHDTAQLMIWGSGDCAVSWKWYWPLFP